jgi:hypothetical protein
MIGEHYRDFRPTLATEKLTERHNPILSVESTRHATDPDEPSTVPRSSFEPATSSQCSNPSIQSPDPRGQCLPPDDPDNVQNHLSSLRTSSSKKTMLC